jgi:glycine dehydrogenase subunit 1
MPYIQNSDADREAMLARIGLSSLDELFAAIPEEVRLQGLPDLPEGLTEPELQAHMAELGADNQPAAGSCFLGGGSYDHSWPTLVDHLMQRSEFLTAYTPYQPECSQGTLQWIYEFQSMIAELCGCEIANASMYDGATAAAEAMLMALGQTRRSKVVVSAGVHPETRETIATYLHRIGASIVEAPLDGGLTDWQDLVDGDTAAVLVQQPNFLGGVEELAAVAARAAEVGALSVAAIYPVAMGLLKSPGELGFDIVVGEGQSLGVPMGYGGPGFGFFAASQKAVRRLPGRIVGLSVDTEGRRAYTLTFQTREQHIRREKATSNICTNNSLIALRGCIHMAAIGPEGLEEVACVSRQRMLALVEALEAAGIPRAFPDTPFFNECAFRLESDEAVTELKAVLLEQGLHAVLPMSRWYDGMEGVFTLATTEKTRVEDIHLLAQAASANLAHAPA